MKIKIAGLENGTHTYNFKSNVKKLELNKPFDGEVNTKVVLNKFEDQIIIDVTTKIKAYFVCDRCDKDYSSIVESSYKMVYLSMADDTGKDSPDITYVSPNTDKIDISSDVRDYAILAVPMKKLCRIDCKGLCYKCGKDLNEGDCDCEDEIIDERLKPLLNLKNKFKIN
ncbi:hypothetical protein BMS3Abin03_01773 [bacterium BMS3Abin03]|nr:hypothetical protein BMS3Abin03_01773 [bacterium BMS3Abin03]